MLAASDGRVSKIKNAALISLLKGVSPERVSSFRSAMV
jgi:hypothetical protein